ncbi:MAG: caspase family protein [Bryobacteraceae bacterium]
MLVRRWTLLCLVFALGGAAQTGNKGVKVSPRDAARFQKEKKLALIVGINDYQEESGLSKLKYAVSDAEDLATALQSYDYAVDLLTDSRAMKVPIRRHLDDLLKRVEPDSGTVLFAFSGHGGQVGSVSYLATYDAGADSLDKDGIAVDEIKNLLAESKAARRMMFLDACRSVTAPGGKDGEAPIAAFSRLADAKGLRMLISTGPKTRSFESDKLQHGVFTYYLLAGLKGGAADRDGLITFNKLADYVTDKVKEDKPGQVPYTDGQSTGDFFLGYKAPPPPKVPLNFAMDFAVEREFLEDFASQLPKKDAQLAAVLRKRAEAMRTADEAPEKPALAPKTEQVAELRKRADSLYDNKDYRSAYPLYQQLAGLGDGWGMARMGTYDLGDRGIAQNYSAAEAWYRKAIQAGEPAAMNDLGVMYANGEGVAKDEAQAVSWYRKAADAGNPAGMTNLGWMYAAGWGVAKDDAQAVSWYRKGADAGNPDAMYYLGGMYADGRGVAKDDAQAVSWCRKAADAGNPASMTELGWRYFTGWGVAKDGVQAVSWYRKGADAGNPEAMNYLGSMYAAGWGIAKDDAQAVSWYRKAADAGLPIAMNNLGVMYADGRGVAKDDAQAVSWYRKGADAGNPDAMNYLGRMYADGRGVAEDDAQAVSWYRKAADAGFPVAMNNLGVMYENGRGVTKDLQQAIAWYRKASKAGSEAAKQALARLGQQIAGVK